ncbi:MAG: phosphoribosylglycinamide formyltransferase [Nanoarchaeota archaeon]|nr:phosphoribosylglycinamide formyltransferase [Nanoarchaeota archaeon]
MKIAVLGSTKGTDLLHIIDAIDDKRLKNIEVVVVISNKEHSGILELARKNDLPAIYLSPKEKEAYDQEISKILEEKKVELILLIGYMKILSKEFVKRWERKILNVHPSLLPKFAANMDLNVHQAAIDANETESGMTIHYVDESVDGGEIILQKKCDVQPGETAQSLKEKVQRLEGEGFVEVLKEFSKK